MKSKFLGDAYDPWKGWVLSLLRDDKVITRNFGVIPMLTERWKHPQNDLQTYSSLLRLKSRKAILHKRHVFMNRQPMRDQYWRNAIRQSPKRDIFLDPDTGISKNGNGREKHIRIDEIRQLLDNTSRVLIVYQHRPHVETKVWLRRLRHSLFPKGCGLSCCVYTCGQVAMFFVSRKKRSRLDPIHSTLTAHLRGTAQGRVEFL